jgi:uncharacterized membrane protein YbhN (UPF0104 family)
MSEPRSRGRWVSVLGSVVVLAVGYGLIASLPRLLGVSWAAVGSNLAAVPAVVLVGLLALWFLGLLVHVPVLRAAMPGLTVRQALTLNLSGSAVSNVFPFGGPAGMGLGYAMARSWGFGSQSFASYTVTTNLWNAVGKFVMGIGVLAGATVFGVALPSGLGPVVLSATVFIAVVAAATFSVLRTENATRAAAGRLDWLVSRVRTGADPGACGSWLIASRGQLAVGIRRSWKVMTAGVLAYLCLQATLLFACLAAVGAGAPVVAVVIAFAIERLISLAPITPGAAGVAELGTVAALHFFGVAPATAAAGVLLYRVLMFAIEIPVGGVLGALWVRRRPAPVPPSDTPEGLDLLMEAAA